MALKRRGSLVVVLVVVATVTWASVYGVRAHFERQVYVTVIEGMLGNDRAGIPPEVPLNVFISRPYYCEGSSVLATEPVLRSMRRANGQGISPIPLNAIEGQVPVVSWEDTKRIANAGYLWYPKERGLVWVSRVGFSGLFSEAAICMANSNAPHGWGSLFILERRGLQWSVIFAEHDASAI